MTNQPLQLLYEELYGKYIPNAIDMCQRDGGAFDDSTMLDAFRPTFARYWQERRTEFVRHQAFELLLERTVEFAKVIDLKETQAIEDLLRAFLAAEIELRIPSEMTREQRLRLTTLLYSVGRKFFATKQWHAHAAHCLSLAAQLFGDLKMHHEVDVCLYYEHASELRRKRGIERLWGTLLYFIAGFGYRPYRMLGAGVVLVLSFAAIFRGTEPDWSGLDCLLFSGMNYFTMIGRGDVEAASALTRVLVLAEVFVALVMNSTFVALLARKWFRS